MEHIKKPTTIIIILLVILIALVVFTNRPLSIEAPIIEEAPVVTTTVETKPTPTPTKPAGVVTTTTAAPVKKAPYDTKNTWILFDGRQVKLVNGFALITASDPYNNESLQHIGYETIGDFNGDTKPDVAFLLTRQNKNAGPLYQIATIVSTENGQKTTNMVVIGDRIKIQSVKFDSNTREISVNYLQRKQNEPITTTPTVPVTAVLKVTEANELEKIR